MTEPKILSPQEALRALADGKKLKLKRWTFFIQFNGMFITDDNGRPYPCSQFTDFVEYTEPKPKRKVAPYYIEYDDGAIELKQRCFETDDKAKEVYGHKRIHRCTALEVEI